MERRMEGFQDGRRKRLKDGRNVKFNLMFEIEIELLHFLDSVVCVKDGSGILLWSFSGTKDTANSLPAFFGGNAQKKTQLINQLRLWILPWSE
jgi:hypothetical protein